MNVRLCVYVNLSSVCVYRKVINNVLNWSDAHVSLFLAFVVLHSAV